MCEYVQEVKDCLARFTEGEQAFSAWNVTQAVRTVVGHDVAVSHDEVKGMVHILMEQNDDFGGRFNGKFVEYIPTVEEKEEEGDEKPVHLSVVKTEPDLENFLDREHLVFRGEVVKLRFDQPVSVVEIRAG